MSKGAKGVQGVAFLPSLAMFLAALITDVRTSSKVAADAGRSRPRKKRKTDAANKDDNN